MKKAFAISLPYIRLVLFLHNAFVLSKLQHLNYKTIKFQNKAAEFEIKLTQH